VVSQGEWGMLKLYILPSSHSSRKAMATLAQYGMPYEVQNMNTSRLTFEQLKQILSLTNNGVEDIIASGKEIKMLEEEGVNLEEITLKEFYYYVKNYPRLIRAQLAIYKGELLIGFNEEEYRRLKPRTMRLEAYFEQLEQARANEDIKLEQGKAISLGHWR
jgi:regulatory protein spx